ncbi:retrovirus-related pol polyprotein from transposon TNT 1-94 [Tanacetum coccineum]
MSTQQYIYAAGSENRPPMLNKENYVPWSSRLLRYAKSRPNGKLIYNSIINGPYVRRMIPEPGDAARAVPTILLSLPEDIYAAVDSCETAQETWCVQQMMKGSDIGIQEKKAKLPHNCNEHGTCSNGQGLQTKLLYTNQQQPENLIQPLKYADCSAGNRVVQNAVQNPGVQNVRNQNGLIVVPGITNQNRNGNVVAARAEGNANGNNGNQLRCYNCRGLGHLARNCTVRPQRRDVAYLQTQLLIAQKEEVGIQLQAEEFDLMAAAADLDEIEEVNANYNLMANLQHASTSGTQSNKAPVYDSDGSTKQAQQKQQSLYNGKVLLEKHDPPAVYDSEETLELAQETKFVRDFQSLTKEADESLAKHKALEWEIERLLRVVVSQDIMSVVQNNSAVDTSNLQTELEHTFDPLPQKLENENVELEFQVRNYEKENAHLKIAYKNLFDSINVTRAQTKLIVDSLQNKLHDTIYENAKLRAQLFDKVSEQEDTTKGSKVNKPIKASVRTNSITVPQPRVITKKVVNSDSNGFSSTEVDITTKTRRPQPRSNTKNDRVPSASKSSRIKNKEVKVEDHPRNLLLSKNKKHMSSECNNVKLAIQNDKSEIVCAMCKQCLITANHDICVLKYVNGMNSHDPVTLNVIQICLWCVDSGCFKHMTRNLKLLINFVWKFLGTVRFGNDHVAEILDFGDLQWGNILITMVYFVEGLEHNLFSVGQFCDSDLEVAFRRNTCFVRNLEGVDLLKGNRTTNLYTINLHGMTSASPICLMARATYTKSWLWHQGLSHLNFDTINDLTRNDLVTGLPKFKYHKEHLCPLCEQGKTKRASHTPKPVPNSKQRLHLLHMDLCGQMRIASINRKRYVLVIVDDYSHYTWVLFLRSKDEAPEEIKTFLKKITVLLQAPVIIVRTDNGTEFKNQVLQEYFNSVGISHQPSSVCTSTLK